MILETYQEQQAIVQPDPPGQSFATVGTVYEDGIALIFIGTAILLFVLTINILVWTGRFGVAS